MSSKHSKHTGNNKHPRKERNRILTLLLQAVLGLAAATAFVLVGAWIIQAATARIVPLEVSGFPRLKLYQDNLNLGDVALGKTIPMKFEIANVGDRLLQFSEDPYIEVVKGCCPPTPRIGSKFLRPGQTTTITFGLMMHAGMGGYHDLRLHLKTNDPEEPDRTITIISNWV
jgi:hypothetical protein